VEIQRQGVQWSEYSTEIGGPIPALTVAERPPIVPAPRDGGIVADATALDDEEVLSRFPAGAVEMQVFTMPIDRAQFAASFAVGHEGYRSCGPRTGCNAWTKRMLGADGASPANHILARPFLFGTPMTVKLRVTGDDSYEVVIGLAGNQPDLRTPIVAGVATLTPEVPYTSYPLARATTYPVKVTAQGLLFEAPFAEKSDPYAYGFPVVPSGDRTNSEPGYSRQYYWNPSVLVRFNQNW